MLARIARCLRSPLLRRARLAASASARPPFDFDTAPGRLAEDRRADSTIASRSSPTCVSKTLTGTETVALLVRKPVAHDRLQLAQRAAARRALRRRAASRACAATTPRSSRPSRSRARRRPGAHVLAFAYTGKLETRAARVVRAAVPHAGRRERNDALDAVRSDRRAAHVPVLGRARVPRDVRADGDRAGGVEQRLEHAGARRAPCTARWRRRRSGARRRCRRTWSSSPPATSRTSTRPRRGTPVRHLGGARPGTERRVRARERAADPRRLRRVLRLHVPAAEARLDRRPRRLPGRDGKLGRDHVQRPGAAAAGRLDARPPPARVQHPGARDGAPVERRPGDDGLVGRHLAQRELRVVDGARKRPRCATRAGTGGSTRTSPRSAR